jgi:hypothetical protein
MGDPVQNFIFHADHTTNMAAIGSSCLWLANSKKHLARLIEIRKLAMEGSV